MIIHAVFWSLWCKHVLLVCKISDTWWLMRCIWFCFAECWVALLAGICLTGGAALRRRCVPPMTCRPRGMPAAGAPSTPRTINHVPLFKRVSSSEILCKYIFIFAFILCQVNVDKSFLCPKCFKFLQKYYLNLTKL